MVDLPAGRRPAAHWGAWRLQRSGTPSWPRCRAPDWAAAVRRQLASGSCGSPGGAGGLLRGRLRAWLLGGARWRLVAVLVLRPPGRGVLVLLLVGSWSLRAPGAFEADGENLSCTRAIAVRWKLEPDALLAPVCPAGLVPLPLRRRLLPPRLRVRAASAPAGPSSAPSSASRPCVYAVECMPVTAALEQFDAAVERLAA